MFRPRAEPSVALVSDEATDPLTFLVERYWPRSAVADLVRSDDALRDRAGSMTAQGRPVRLIGTTFVPGEETVFGRFEAVDAGAVEELHRLAGVEFDCVTPSIELADGTGGPVRFALAKEEPA
jgi:hypothetical protein